MKKTILSIGLFSVLSAAAQLGHAQQKTQIQQQVEQRNFFRKSLGLDSTKAEQVREVQDNYKKALGLVIADTSLKGEAKRAKIGLLISEKNRKLRLFLSAAQQQKLIPTTEREPVKTEKQY